MTSLAELRRRLACLETKSQKDTGNLESKVKNDTGPLENRTNGDTGSIEITENKIWLEKIDVQGNRPEDWLEYTRFITNYTNFPNNVNKHNYLCGVYERAFKAIDVISNKRNEAYAQLFMDCAQLKSMFSVEDAVELMNQARAIVRRFAKVHVMAAELEYKQGNSSKSKKILDKAVLFGAEPLAVITDALELLNNNATSLLKKSLPEPPTRQVEELQQTSFSCSRPRVVPRSNKLPQRVKVMNLPFREMMEADSDGDSDNKENDTLSHDIRPIDTHTNYSVASSHSSGYCSMMDISMPTEQRTSPQTEEQVHEVSKKITPPDSKPSIGSVRHPLQVIKVSKQTEPMDSELQPAKVPKMNLEQCFSDNKFISGQESSNACVTENKSGSESNHCASSSIENHVVVSHEPLSNSRTVQSTKSSSMSRLIPTKPQPTFTKSESASGLYVRNPQCAAGVSQSQEPNEPSHKILEAQPPDRQVASPPLSDAKIMPPTLLPKANVVPPLNDKKIKTVAPPLPEIPPKGVGPKEDAFIGPTPIKQNTRTNNIMVTPCMKGMPGPAVPCTPSLQTKEITVNGKQYWVLKLVGKGGSSLVYKVLDANLENRAIKVVDLSEANKQILEGYRNEINLLERLQYCSKVIKMYDYEYAEDESKLYIVMEYGTVDFANFIKNRLKEDGHLSPNTMKFYWEDMLQAVGALHKQGIIHSDLKPSNFLVIDGSLRLIDFGIAKSIQCDKTSVVVESQVGTLNYMSPESIMDSCSGEDSGQQRRPTYKLGVKSDVWSLGCILYYMVYGHTPFQKITKTFIKLQAIISPDYPIDFKDIADRNLLDTMKKCLIRDPRQRPGIDGLLAHPYVTNQAHCDKEMEVPECSEDHLEKLVKQLSTKFASSPSGIRSLVHSAIKDGKKK